MTSIIDSEEETIFINRITAGSASRVCNATPLIYQPHRHSSKLREFHNLAFVNWKHMRRFTPFFSSSHITAEDRCSVHAVSPYSCAMFDHTQSREEANALSLRGLMEVARAWQHGDLYAQLWMMLYHAGRIAPSPIEARARMRGAVAAGEYGVEDRSPNEHQ